MQTSALERELEQDGEKAEDRYLRRLNALEQDRLIWEDEWRDITRFAYPRRNSWDVTPNTDKVAASDIYDGTALAALTLMCDGLLGHLVPASIPFFKLKPSVPRLDAFVPLRTWLDDCQYHVLGALERSNYYESLGELFPDAGALGTGTMFMEEDVSQQRVMFSSRHIKECFVAENRWGRVDTVYRKFAMTRRQLVQAFKKGLKAETLKMCEREPDAVVQVLHCVEPAEKPSPDRPPFDSCYLLLDTSGTKKSGQILEEGHYDFLPYIVWRFRKNSDEVYGRSPAMDALNDIKMINHMNKTMAEAAQKAVDPPLMATESMRGRIKKLPGSVTYWETPGESQVRSLYNGALGQYPFGVDALQRRERIIREHFRSDFFSYLLGADQGGQRTATEINAIEAQKAAVLGSTIGRITKELFEPVIHNMIQIEAKAGRLPPPPDEVKPLLGLPLEIEYTGPLAQKQRTYLRSEGVVQGSAAVFGLAQARPEVLDCFDWDFIAKTAAEANGMPQKAELDPKMVQQMRQARMQQQMAMQQAQMQLEAAKVHPALSKAPEPGSPAEGGQA